VQIIIENIRSFAGSHTIPIRPLTILTGENSSGKSTLLAVVSAFHDAFGFPLNPRFNEAPYHLGGFDTIATYKGGRHGRAKSFTVGFIQDDRSGKGATEQRATYRNRLGQAELSELTIKNATGEIHLTISHTRGQQTASLTLSFDSQSSTHEFSLGSVLAEVGRINLADFMMLYVSSEQQKGSRERAEPWTEGLRLRAYRMIRDARLSSAVSIAPIRSRPKRTYDEVTEEFTPEGDHIPYVLRRHLETASPDNKEAFLSALQRFGQQSGLFRGLDIKRLGSTLSDPFRIMVKGAGPPANLLDVGYGVSQALPVLIQSLLTAKGRLLLLQQPEVHLHPRAQAALGTFFVDLINSEGKEFVIETHSDYIVDRIRQEVAMGRLPCDSVVILYLEKAGIETAVYPLSLDRSGNIVGAPPSYREFFLREEMSLLTRKSA